MPGSAPIFSVPSTRAHGCNRTSGDALKSFTRTWAKPASSATTTAKSSRSGAKENRPAASVTVLRTPVVALVGVSFGPVK